MHTNTYEKKIVIHNNINKSKVHTDRRSSRMSKSNLLQTLKSAQRLCGHLSVTNSSMHVLIHYWRGKRIRRGTQQKEECMPLSSPGQEKALRDLWQHDAYFNRSKKDEKKKKRKMSSSLLGLPCHCEEFVPVRPFKVDLENHLRQLFHAWNL